MNTLTAEPEAITRFAAAVRAALSDLSAEEIDELTDGLEADLIEAASESGVQHMGDPRQYANDLRQAAGYSARATPPQGVKARLRAFPDEIRAEWRAIVERFGLGRLVDFFATLRPVWWVFRGWALYLLVAGLVGLWNALPTTVIGWLILVGAVVLSVQFGRGRWLARWMRVPLVLGNILVVVAAPFLASWVVTATNSANSPSAYVEELPWHPGITMDGQQLTNIFAYDENGALLENVQLFDQDGNPLDLVGSAGPEAITLDGMSYLVPNTDVPGRVGWNVYPLSVIGEGEVTNEGLPASDANPRVPKAPFTSVRPLAARDAVVSE
ncbi:hypothetical protein PYV02_11490 [Leifsonia sp. H3M29-4]|uniref:HAAS signaling domain-containing protein n=1 Tax=Salinibacterium metalliresistens TaxID=3031321 RepID=UPI0023D98C75|nr:hypothetical protein [Salinibacterium metalliresistens]MDF1479705.1 hypothetical protein [Salinibacterium metalliresistens]